MDWSALELGEPLGAQGSQTGTPNPTSALSLVMDGD